MTQLELDEFLKACEIPSAQRSYTGSDGAWTTLVNREQVQSLLKVVGDFVSGLREDDGLSDRGRNGEEATRTAPRSLLPASIVTPANQKIFKPSVDSNYRKNQTKNAKEAEKEGHTDSSINTLPVLLPKQADRGNGEQQPGTGTGTQGGRPGEALDTDDSGMKGQIGDKKKQMESSSQMAGNGVSVSHTQEVMDTTSPAGRNTRLKSLRSSTWADADDARRQEEGKKEPPYPGNRYVEHQGHDITEVRRRLAQASRRRKSLEPPIDADDANRMDGLRSMLEERKRPQYDVGNRQGVMDGIHGANQYLVSDGGESAGASIGSAAGNGNVLHIGKSRLGVDARGTRPAVDSADEFFDFNKLPAHLKKSLDLIKKHKLAHASAAKKKKKKKAIDLTGLQRMKEYDPRRLMH